MHTKLACMLYFMEAGHVEEKAAQFSLFLTKNKSSVISIIPYHMYIYYLKISLPVQVQ